jgi:CRP-like cAMP-binding protein
MTPASLSRTTSRSRAHRACYCGHSQGAHHEGGHECLFCACEQFRDPSAPIDLQQPSAPPRRRAGECLCGHSQAAHGDGGDPCIFCECERYRDAFDAPVVPVQVDAEVVGVLRRLCDGDEDNQLAVEDVELLATAGHSRRFMQGSLVIKADDPADRLLIVLKGSVRIEAGEGQAHLDVEAGGVVPEAGALSTAGKLLRVGAEEDVLLLELSAAGVKKTVGNEPALLRAFAAIVTREAAAILSQLGITPSPDQSRDGFCAGLLSAAARIEERAAARAAEQAASTGAPAPSDTVHAQTAALPSGRDLRRAPRTKVDLDGWLVPDGHDGCKGKVLNLSIGGCLVLVERRFDVQPGATGRMRFGLPEYSRWLEPRVEVKRASVLTQPDGPETTALALQFFGLTPQDEQAIARGCERWDRARAARYSLFTPCLVRGGREPGLCQEALLTSVSRLRAHLTFPAGSEIPAEGTLHLEVGGASVSGAVEAADGTDVSVRLRPAWGRDFFLHVARFEASGRPALATAPAA